MTDLGLKFASPSLIRAICEQPFEGRREWRAHGIGMLRTYLDEEKTVRLNLWHHTLVNRGISVLHTHPWPFTSHLVAGYLENTIWDRVVEGTPAAMCFMEDTIKCGPHFDGLSGNPKEVYLRPQMPTVIRPTFGNRMYQQRPDEIHSTYARDGSATVMERGPAETSDHVASIFWPYGETWGDATRDVTADEIVRVCHDTLSQLNLL